MESNNVADQSAVEHSVSTRSQKQICNVNESDCKQNNVECSDFALPVKEAQKAAKSKDDDQESVIIEEVENNIIELNDDTEDELCLKSDNVRTELPAAAKNALADSTEFVAVNAANMRTVEIGDGTGATNSYSIDDIQIKDELDESITADLNSNDVLENDPMDLLVLNTRSETTGSDISEADTDDYVDDDISSVGSCSIQTGSSSLASIFDWIKEYPWLLHEEGEEQTGYCLYCDSTINAKSQRAAKQHGLSLYHKERCENYLAFREEEDKNGLCLKLVEIKEEFGTDSRVEALKLKRKSQSEALNNFNWRRWLDNHSWLERHSPEGTIGYCKYCHIHVNVEFSYLRDRHQDCAKHKESEKQYEEGTKEHQEQIKSITVNVEKESSVDISQYKNTSLYNQRWLELLDKEPAMARCKVCGTKMFKNNFLRHLRTNLHEHNEQIYLQNNIKDNELEEQSTKYLATWKLHKKRHPWLVPDPVDPTFAYCIYCEKRIFYGASAAKRTLHENSSQHKHNEGEFKKRSHIVNNDEQHGENETDRGNELNENKDHINRNNEGEEGSENQSEENEASVDDEVDNEVGNEENKDEDEEQVVDNEDGESRQGKESEEENETKKRVYKLSEKWLNQYPWCKRYKKDPSNFIFCIYCKIPLSVSYSRSKHQTTSFHVSAEKEFLFQQAKKQKVYDRKEGNEAPPFYEWAIQLKDSPSSYSCRYCRVRISKHYSKKQHASSKIHQINESIYKSNRRMSLRKDEHTNSEVPAAQSPLQQLSNVETEKKPQEYTKAVLKGPSTVALIKQYQKKFPWLSYKRTELRSHYGYCKVCDSSLYIRSFKHILRHVRSGKHSSIIKAKKKEKHRKNDGVAKMIKKVSKDELPASPNAINNSTQNQANTTLKAPEVTDVFEYQKAYNYKSTIGDMKKRFSWIENSEMKNYAFCRFCDCDIPLKIVFLRNHSNSQKHRHCVINYYSNDRKNPTEENRMVDNATLDNNSKFGDIDDDLLIVEDTNEEILISEQDENWTVKSETMDEHEELDYLLQRSFNNTLNASNMQRNVRKNVINEGEPPAKRIKKSQTFKRLNDSNSSLVASLLTTPLTLASCLGPLIQQQIQQQANISQTTTNSGTAVAVETPRATHNPFALSENSFDLFFKSISETMKKLPLDLAAEGKLRVMQIICDLELQALKRQHSERNESPSGSINDLLSYKTTSMSSGTHPISNKTVSNDISMEQPGFSNETIITQINGNTEQSPPSATHLPSNATQANAGSMEKTVQSSNTSSIIGVMDKNALQPLQLKASVSKQVSRNTTTTITNVTNPGIRCIPFKNLSQPATPDTSNAKITRIQVPITVPPQTPNANATAANPTTNLINFRNIQITKRVSAQPKSATSTTVPQQTSAINNNSSQRNFIANIQPQMQRWRCTVNGTTSKHTPPNSPTVNHLQQLSSQQTSTPNLKK